ncbi:MAG: hypothetical protein AAF735_03555 [Myxococcota bacterium]
MVFSSPVHRNERPSSRGQVISMGEARDRRVQVLKALVRSGRYQPNLVGTAEALIDCGALDRRPPKAAR